MTFKAYAGNIYLGKLHVFKYTQAFFPAFNHKPFYSDTTVDKLHDYKNLTLRRTL